MIAPEDACSAVERALVILYAACRLETGYGLDMRHFILLIALVFLIGGEGQRAYAGGEDKTGAAIVPLGFVAPLAGPL